VTGSAHTPDPADIPDDLSGLTGEPDDAILGDPDLDAADDSEDDVDPRHRAPLVVDAAPLHALVDELNELLHSYVGTAVGVRAEFDAATAEDDPRVGDLEDRIGALNTRLSEAFEQQLGLVSGHTNESWDDDEDEDDEDDDESGTFELSFVVDVDGALDHEARFTLVDSVGAATADQLEAAGLDVQHWGVSFLGDEDEDDEE